MLVSTIVSIKTLHKGNSITKNNQLSSIIMAIKPIDGEQGNLIFLTSNDNTTKNMTLL